MSPSKIVDDSDESSPSEDDVYEEAAFAESDVDASERSGDSDDDLDFEDSGTKSKGKGAAKKSSAASSSAKKKATTAAANKKAAAGPKKAAVAKSKATPTPKASAASALPQTKVVTPTGPTRRIGLSKLSSPKSPPSPVRLPANLK